MELQREKDELQRMVEVLQEEIQMGNQRRATSDQDLAHDRTQSQQSQPPTGTVGDVSDSPCHQTDGNHTNTDPATPRGGEESSYLRSRSSSEESMDICDIDAEGRKLEERKRVRGNEDLWSRRIG